jgi:hypothetical protein
MPNFRELPQDEIRRILLLRTWVNKDKKEGLSILPRPSWTMGTYCLG